MSHGEFTDSLGDTIPLSAIRPPAKQSWHLPREGLCEKLERSIQTHKVVLLCAPSGYGKTTVLAEIARTYMGEVAWLNATESDCSSQQLLFDLTHSILNANSAISKTAKIEHQLSLVSLANYVTVPSRNWLLIIDDLDKLLSFNDSMRLIETFINSTPEHVTIALASSHWNANLFNSVPRDTMAVYHGAELAFDRDELEDGLAELDVPITAWRMLVGVRDLSNGWPAAVGIALRKMQLSSDLHAMDLETSIQEHFERSAMSTIGILPDASRAFLCQISHLYCISPQISDACLGRNDSALFLETLCDESVFIERGKSGEYVMHPLFKRFLRRKYGNEYHFDEATHRLAANLLGHDGNSIGELYHRLAARDYSSSLSCIDSLSQDIYYREGRGVLVEMLNDDVVAPDCEVVGRLTVLRTEALLSLDRATEAIRVATDGISNVAIDDALRRRLKLLRCYAYRSIGALDACRDDAEDILAMTREESTREFVSLKRLLASIQISMLHVDEANRHIDEALLFKDKLTPAADHTFLISDLSYLQLIQGNVVTGIDTSLAAKAMADEAALAEASAMASNNIAFGLQLMGQTTRAAGYLDEALALSRSSDRRATEALIWIGAADLALDSDELGAALRQYNRGLRLAMLCDERSLSAYALGGLATICRLVGNFKEAQRLLSEARRYLSPSHRYEAALHAIRQAELDIGTGAAQQAVRELATVVADLESGGLLVDLARARLVMANGLFTTYGIKPAVTALEKVLDAMHAVGTGAFLVPMVRRMPRLMRALLAIDRPDLYNALGGSTMPEWLNSPGGAPIAIARYNDPHPELLNVREIEVVIALCEGLTRDQVAARIGRSRSTLDKLISTLYAATGFESTHQLVAWAHRVGLFTPRAGRDDDGFGRRWEGRGRGHE